MALPKGKLDSKKHIKRSLVVRAIESWISTWARGLEVFLWMKPVCVLSEAHIRSVLSYIERCDCLLTPVVDKSPESWPLQRTHRGLFIEYVADHFQEYLSTPWGRLEMIAATRVPRLKDTFDVRVLMGDELLGGTSGRPHFVYGTKEILSHEAPLILPIVRQSEVNHFNPNKASGAAADVAMVKELWKNLESVYKTQHTVGYKGSTDQSGAPHGIGMRTFENGDRYNGAWENGYQHGFGVYLYSDGSKYEGDWVEGKRHGNGKFVFWSGNVEESEYRDDMQHGRAVFKRVGGGMSRGTYEMGQRHGEWIREDPDGKVVKLAYDNGTQVSRQVL
eukprot:c13885_g1_i1.p1 GENE.c13885_g1_i1~~c13885_g1_i1.p1  ORF type:complete len:333 (+),score=66.86 c13885_g1_i1:227-1225(+)